MIKTVAHILAQYPLVDGYPTLMFFKSGLNSAVTNSGRRDMDTLMTFVDQQMGIAPAKVKVINKMCLVVIDLSLNFIVKT